MHYDCIINPHVLTELATGFVWVLENPGISKTGKSGKKATDPGKFYKYVDLK